MMIKYTDIHKSIVNMLDTTGIDTTSKDVSEGFDRPSFFMSFDNVKASDFMREALDREITVRIYYFSENKDKNKIELLEMQDILSSLFLDDNLIRVNDYFNIEVDELDFSIVDKVLHCYFDIRLTQDYNRIDNMPYMEELDIERKG